MLGGSAKGGEGSVTEPLILYECELNVSGA